MPRERQGIADLRFPLLSDKTGQIARDYGVLLENEGVALRGLFLIDPDGIIQYSVTHNLNVGRSVDERCGSWKPCSRAACAGRIGSRGSQCWRWVKTRRRSGYTFGTMSNLDFHTASVSADCGVLVCGGGTAGVVAAITAARAGADVLVVEQLGQLGGTQSAGWVTPMMPNKILTENLTHGLNDEILHRAAQYDPPPTEKSGDLLWFNPITLALVLDDLLAESGARVLYHTWISDSIVENGTLTGIVIENKSGRQLIRARLTIDCTGDADVAFSRRGAVRLRRPRRRPEPADDAAVRTGRGRPGTRRRVSRRRTRYELLRRAAAL